MRLSELAGAIRERKYGREYRQRHRWMESNLGSVVEKTDDVEWRRELQNEWRLRRTNEGRNDLCSIEERTEGGNEGMKDDRKMKIHEAARVIEEAETEVKGRSWVKFELDYRSPKRWYKRAELRFEVEVGHGNTMLLLLTKHDLINTCVLRDVLSASFSLCFSPHTTVGILMPCSPGGVQLSTKSLSASLFPFSK